MKHSYYVSLYLRAALTGCLYLATLVYLFFALTYLFNLPYWLCYGAAAGLLVVFYAAFPGLVDRTLPIQWAEAADLPAPVYDFIIETASVNRIPAPRIGILDDSIPNLYGYGHWPRDARLVITRGLIDLLDEAELKAVLAYELGNIKSCGFAVLGMGLFLPLLCARTIQSLLKRRKILGRVSAIPVALLYLVLHIGMFFCYPFSRYRSYYADAFSCFVTDDVNPLIQAILKIIGHATTRVMSEDVYENVYLPSAIKPLGFLDPSFAGHMALKSLSEVSDDLAGIADLIKKDMQRPRLATELLGYSHLHPFVRIMYLEETAISMGLLSNFDFRGMKMVSEGSGVSYFAYEYLSLLGLLCGLLLAAFSLHLYGSPVVALFNGLLTYSCFYGLKLYLSYPGQTFQPLTLNQIEEQSHDQIHTLLPVQISGRIYPQYLPGKIFSNNAVIVDETGVAILDFQKPLGFFEIFFRLLFSQSFKEENATVYGWYRHFDVSTVEVHRIRFEDGAQVTSPVYRNKIWFIAVLWLLCLGLFIVAHLT